MRSYLEEPSAVEEARYGLYHRNARSNLNTQRLMLCQAINFRHPCTFCYVRFEADVLSTRIPGAHHIKLDAGRGDALQYVWK